MMSTEPESRTLIIAKNFGSQLLGRIRFRLGHVASVNGATHRRKPLERSLDYIDRVFGDYLEYSGLQTADLAGKSVLEIGPGDNLGVALKFLAADAARVVSIDKFLSERDNEQELSIYRSLRSRLLPDQQLRFDSVIDLSSGRIQFDKRKLEYIYGHGIEQADRVFKGQPFDLMVSRVVLQEVDDGSAVFRALDHLLRPGGYHVHKIELRDYGMFSRHGHHPLEFLTVPDLVYSCALKYCHPNRCLIDFYRREMQALGYEARVFATRVIGAAQDLSRYKLSLEKGVDYTGETLDLVRTIRPRLLKRYQALTDEDLMTAGLMLVAKKKPSYEEL
jgi:hypothetical protein